MKYMLLYTIVLLLWVASLGCASTRIRTVSVQVSEKPVICMEFLP